MKASTVKSHAPKNPRSSRKGSVYLVIASVFLLGVCVGQLSGNLVAKVSSNDVSAGELSETSYRLQTLAKLQQTSNQKQEKTDALKGSALLDEMVENIHSSIARSNETLARIYKRSRSLRTTGGSGQGTDDSHGDAQRILVVTFVNFAYVRDGFVQNWLCSLHKLNIQNYAIIALDKASATELKKLEGVSPGSIVDADSVFWEPSWWTMHYTSGSIDLSQSLRVTRDHILEEYIFFVFRRQQILLTLLDSFPKLDIVMTDADGTLTQNPWDVVNLMPFSKAAASSQYQHPRFSKPYNNCHLFLMDKTGNRGRIVAHQAFMILRNHWALREFYRYWTKITIATHLKEGPSFRITESVFTERNQLHYFTPHQYSETIENRHNSLNFCTLDEVYYPHRHVFKSSYYRKTYPNASNNIAWYHANIANKTHEAKQEYLKNDGQWHWNFDSQTCL